MGLLDALILSAQAAAAAPSDDRIIKAGPPQPDPTLADYLYPTPVEGVAVAPRDIETVLRSIKAVSYTHLDVYKRQVKLEKLPPIQHGNREKIK